ncbi:MAG: sugar transferase [Chitinophagaceae bacterium]|nr:MAG: sugar transferase [Chitinophagaceae bacterium]
MKRLIDITFASIILLAILPVLVMIAIAIRIDSKGPIIYSSLRAGKGFRIFKFYKFRTMVVDADKKMEQFAHLNQYSNEDGSEAKFVKIANDPRITRLGKILRNCSLDELPQLFNVIKGDMSLVGNRPLPLYEAATLTTDAHVERFMAPAGITGLWQIKKRGNAEMSVEERINLDISYARRYNVVYDLWIVANTPAALFQKTNV